MFDCRGYPVNHNKEKDISKKAALRDRGGGIVRINKNSPLQRVIYLFLGFLRSRREKRKEKKKNKKRDGSDSTGKEVRDEKENSEPKSEAPTPEVDEEGYRIRPKEEMWDAEKFYSSSDSDSDDDRDHKIHVEIKPLSANTNQISASVDELRVTAGNLTLSPLSVKERRNSIDINPEVNFSQSPHKKINGLAELNHALMKTMGDSASTEDKPDHVDPTEPPLGLLSGNTPPPSSSTSTEKTTSDSSSTSKYTNLGDLFSEVGEIVPALPPKQTARMTPTLTSSTISLPRPPSRRSEGRGHISPLNSTLTRSESEFKTSGVSTTNSSRGPSPLTIGMSDTIPLAVAFHEIIHSYFRGTDETRCQVKMSGDMMLSFPAGIVSILTSNPSPAQLKFKVSNISHIENMLPNKQLINIEENKLDKSSDSMTCEFNMSALSSLLRKQCEQNPSASYFNVDILKYQIKSKPGAESCPFQLVAHWKCEPTHTDLKVDYKYNNHAMGSPSPLLNVVLAVPVDGEVTNVQAKPNVQWLPETNRAIWKFTDLSQHSENHGIGCVKARFELKNGPGTPSTIATQFNCEGTTLSGAEFELIGPGYRVSLVKRKFMSGKYICDGDFDNRYGIIPSPSPSDFN
ncbi:F-BAR domain only protein 2-like [Diaphorina citri]|uniref:F-BAR domain only protein 2-like n=1 Tax=Diaphorina citri TaxID=121845 RepID=A0A3Q0J8W8_DIACI|nr:F-BAR domain only protein 2-like [Diaphorina citri]